MKTSPLFTLPIAVLAVVSLGLLAACGPPAEEQADIDRAEIEELLEAYLPLLATAYATGETEPLAAYAAPKEVAIVRKKVDDLAREGSALAPELKELTIEDVTAWNRNNAYVTTLEVWDVRNYAVGTEVVRSEVMAKPHRVKYQLKRRDEGWQVLYRQVDSTF